MARPPTRLTVEQRVARGLILVPERRELFAAMSVADNLELGGFQRAICGERGWRATQQEVYQRFPRLAERRDQLAGTLSGGERQMLAMGRALMGKPTTADARRAVARPGAADRARDLQHRRRAALVGRFHPARRAECARGAAGLRLRLRARDRASSPSRGRVPSSRRIRAWPPRIWERAARRRSEPESARDAVGRRALAPAGRNRRQWRFAQPRVVRAAVQPKDPRDRSLRSSRQRRVARRCAAPVAGARRARRSRALERPRVDPHARRGFRRSLLPVFANGELESRGGHRQVRLVQHRPRRRHPGGPRRQAGIRLLRRHHAGCA